MQAPVDDGRQSIEPPRTIKITVESERLGATLRNRSGDAARETGTRSDVKPWRVLFVCRENSARSILAEALLNDLGGGRFIAFSAGSHPSGRVHPLALETLRHFKIPSNGFRSKSWSEFGTPDAAPLDMVITVCDRVARERCPMWPGQPICAHWSIRDPAAIPGARQVREQAFLDAALDLRCRIQQLLRATPAKLDQLAIRRALG